MRITVGRYHGRKPVGSGSTCVPVLYWEYCICVMFCILFPTYENGGSGPVLGDIFVHNNLVHNKWAREKLSVLHLQTYSKRLVLGQTESPIFLLLLPSLSLNFCLYTGKKYPLSPLRFSVCIEGFGDTCDVGRWRLGKKFIIVQKQWHFPAPNSCFFLLF